MKIESNHYQSGYKTTNTGTANSRMFKEMRIADGAYSSNEKAQDFINELSQHLPSSHTRSFGDVFTEIGRQT